MAFSKGELAEIHGLVDKPQHNGKIGLVVAVARERLTLRVIPDNDLLAVRPAKLRSHADSAVTV